ncbi:MAG: hypothetical protein LLF92_03055 [Planctomycetaceae bacterium]|nr:hypothetical protein [Planctomycetaceae bacterium]
MDELENNITKPKLCRLAILSPLLVLISFWPGVLAMVLPDFPEHQFVSPVIFVLSFIGFILSSILTGIIALHKIHKSRKQLRGDFMALLGIVVAVFLLFLGFCMS